MYNFLIKFLHKLNGSSFTKNRVDELKELMHAIEKQNYDLSKQIYDLSHSLQYQVNWHRYKGFGAPLYLLNDGRLALSSQSIEGFDKAVIISIPKSGTYLLSSILEKIGLINTGVQVWETGFHDYRGKTISEMVHRYSEFAVNSPLNLTATLVLQGQFIVGHIECSKETQSLLSAFKRIMSIREMRQSLVSHMLFFENEGRGESFGDGWKKISDPRQRMAAFLHLFAEDLLTLANHVAGWLNDHEILVVKFEDMQGDNGESIQLEQIINIAVHIGKPLKKPEAQALLESVINKPTKTWSGKRSVLDDYWNDECEAIFIAHGGFEINSKLGY
jgi:hypothetical protein